MFPVDMDTGLLSTELFKRTTRRPSTTVTATVEKKPWRERMNILPSISVVVVRARSMVQVGSSCHAIPQLVLSKEERIAQDEQLQFYGSAISRSPLLTSATEEQHVDISGSEDVIAGDRRLALADSGQFGFHSGRCPQESNASPHSVVFYHNWPSVSQRKLGAGAGA
jgi:hypothetical protein